MFTTGHDGCVDGGALVQQNDTRVCAHLGLARTQLVQRQKKKTSASVWAPSTLCWKVYKCSCVSSPCVFRLASVSRGVSSRSFLKGKVNDLPT